MGNIHNLHPSITDEEYMAVVDRLRPIEVIQTGTDESGCSITDFDGETADEWYDRNVKAVGEDTAVIWFKQKAARQLKGAADA